MAKEGKGYKQNMFLNKDGYLKGGNKISVPSQNLEIDPRGRSSIRGAGVYVATGDKVTVKGTGKARKQTAKWY